LPLPPELEVPELELPELELPDVEPPELELPDVEPPELAPEEPSPQAESRGIVTSARTQRRECLMFTPENNGNLNASVTRAGNRR
jgi:hypothetical protein